MRKLASPTAILFFACFASLPTVAADPDAQLKTVLEGRYADMKVAMAERDPVAIQALLAPGFESVDVDGKVQTADQMVSMVSALPRDPKKESDTTLVKVVQEGETVTVSQSYHMTTTKNRPDGTSQAVEILTVSTDTWLPSSGKWLLRSTITETVDYRVDGRTIVHKVRQPG